MAEFSAKDLLPVPESTDPNRDEVSHSMSQQPTASHALAQEDHEEKGAAQLNHTAEVVDLGWNKPSESIPQPLVGGLGNEELWVLIRRFNKQMYHVKETPKAPAGGLDLNIADEEEFSPDKLRAHLERFYLTAALGLLASVKHIARIRSWRETRRTACFCGAYFAAWLLDILIPVLVLAMMALIVYPPSRSYLFPPAPIALVDSSGGGVQKPKAGVLGSTDTATGAPEHHKGEAAEAEAAHFVNTVASIALASASGKHPQGQSSLDEGEIDNTVDPTAVAVHATEARSTAQRKDGTGTHDKSKVPMETAIWTKIRPIMHGLSEVTDTWERFANALSPTPPFPRNLYRFRLASLLIPLLASSLYTTPYMFCKGASFIFGFAFFGDPILSRTFAWFNRTVPHWQKLLEPRNTILKGIPTNAQLTITLLRIGEANKAPLPPPPVTGAPPPDEPIDIPDEELRAIDPESTDEELHEAIAYDPSVPHQTGSKDVQHSKDTRHGKKGSRLIGFVKSGIKGSIETALGADRLKAKAGSSHAKQRLGVLPRSIELTGPVDFACRHQGKKGHAYISTKATIPCVSFSLDPKIATQGTLNREEAELNPIWSVAVADIKEIKKIGGFGWKTKLLVGWALSREIADGVEIVTRREERFILTAMVLREELFNRLIAMGGQKWESW